MSELRKSYLKIKCVNMLCFSNAHTGGAIKYVEAIMAQGINFFRRGMVSDAMEKYSDASKLMLSIPDGALHPCLAEILCNQALGMLYSGMHLFSDRDSISFPLTIREVHGSESDG